MKAAQSGREFVLYVGACVHSSVFAVVCQAGSVFFVQLCFVYVQYAVLRVHTLFASLLC